MSNDRQVADQPEHQEREADVADVSTSVDKDAGVPVERETSEMSGIPLTGEEAELLPDLPEQAAEQALIPYHPQWQSTLEVLTPRHHNHVRTHREFLGLEARVPGRDSLPLAGKSILLDLETSKLGASLFEGGSDVTVLIHLTFYQ